MKCTLCGTLSVDKPQMGIYSEFEVISMDYKNATEFRKNLFASLEKIVEFEEVMTVTTKKGNAVIMSEKEYKGLMETLSLLGQPGFLERIKEVEEGKEGDFVEINAEKGL